MFVRSLRPNPNKTFNTITITIATKTKYYGNKKVYPFIHAKRWDRDLVDNVNVVFDAREVESYGFYPRKDDDIEEDGVVIVYFKSGRVTRLYLALDPELYPGDNLITAIDRVQDSHFWHDNEDSLPDEDEE